MNYRVGLLLLLPFTTLFAQPDTEVYMVSLSISGDQIKTSQFRNISQNKGYDNQPYFLNDENLLFAKTRNGQTDIAQYDISNRETHWRTNTPQGGEYSPFPLPETQEIAAVRLDTTGLQRLYRYGGLQDQGTVVPEGIQVAYYTFLDAHRALASVLGQDGLHLVAINLASNRVDTLLYNAGRSLHTMANSDLASYTFVNEQGNYDVYQYDFNTGESYFIVQLPIGIQDHIWLDDNRLLVGSGAKLFLYDLFGNGKWEEIADFSEEGITNISRMALSPNGLHLALVAELKP